eukprot:1582097-Rhodomonas_salina.1
MVSGRLRTMRSHQQVDGEDPHHAAVERPRLGDEPACHLAVRDVVRLVVLHRVLDPGSHCVADKVVDGRAHEREQHYTGPPVPGVQLHPHEERVRRQP